MSDNKSAVIIIAILAICATIITCSYFSYQTKKDAAVNGRYVKVSTACVFDKWERKYLFRSGMVVSIDDSIKAHSK